MNTILRVKDYLLTTGRTDLAEIVSATSVANGMQKAELRAEIDRLRAELASWRRTCETITDERDESRRLLDRAISELNSQSTVPEICNAYESGVGHAGRPTASVNPYKSGTDLFVAYAIGANGDKHNDAPVPAQPAVLPLEIAADIRSDDYVSPRLRGELGMPSHIAELATNIRRNIAKAQQHVIADSDIEPDGEMLDLLNHIDTIAQQIETDTAQPEYPGKQNDVYTDILTGVPTCKFCVGKKSHPSAVPEAVAKYAARYLWLRSQKNLHLQSEKQPNTWTRPDGSKFSASHYLAAGNTAYEVAPSLDETIDAAILSAADDEGKK